MSSKIVEAIHPVSQRFLRAVETAMQDGLDQREVLYGLEITEGALRKIQLGKTRRPFDKTINRLQRLGISPGWVRTGEGEMRTAPGEYDSTLATKGAPPAADALLRRALTEAYAEIDRLRTELSRWKQQSGEAR